MSPGPGCALHAGRVAIVAHDAGGAEILSSLVRRERAAGRHEQSFVLTGPALQIFQAKLGRIERLPLEQALTNAAWLLCGTGWQCALQLDAIARARELRLHSVAFLDHWVNYQERFIRQGQALLPDEIWVGDAMAQRLACQAFPGLPVSNAGNAYFDDVRLEFAMRPPPCARQGLSVLFVGEAIREHALRAHGNALHWGYTQDQALAYFLDHADALGAAVSQILVRPHPAEDPAGYAHLLRRQGVALAREGDLFSQIAASNWVVGCNTMAMVVALMAGRCVLSCIPPGGQPCMLPQPEIVHLQTMLANTTRP